MSHLLFSLQVVCGLTSDEGVFSSQSRIAGKRVVELKVVCRSWLSWKCGVWFVVELGGRRRT